MSDDDWGEPTSTSKTKNDEWGESSTPASNFFDDGGSRGRGRGKGGVGGGGSRACYKCGDEGHMSRECPSGGGDSGNRPKGCFKCGEDGHMSRDCPSGGGDSGNRPKGCFKCGEEGHMSRDCPSGGGDSGNRPKGCFKCGEEGHMSRDCPSGGGDGDNRPKTCRKCNEEGHFARECPQGGGDDGDSRPKGCFNCGEEGHMSKECPNPPKERGPRKVMVDGEEKTLENYVPPEMLDGDAIFEERSKLTEGMGINFAKYEKIPHSITGDNKVPSIGSFQGMGLRPLIQENLKKCNYERPTPIQRHGTPQMMAGIHVMCCAQTGSGKTAAFLLPIIHNLLENQETLGTSGSSPVRPEACILAPTRELAIQIGNEANMYAAGSIIKTQVVYGGTATHAVKNKLIRGCNILVATTGRLRQFIRDGLIDLSNVRYFILDEADRMLDMGFMGDVEEIVAKMPDKEKRVSGMFSATFPEEIQNAAKKFLHEYVFVVIGVVGGACTDVQQEFIELERSGKRDKIFEILQEEGKGTKTLVFCASKKGADFLAANLASKQVSVTSIHGDRLQSQREQALREFTTGKRQVLVATAVAARGLDIPKVALVINYDLPSEIDEYVHRIGRTGRVGHTGRAISFFDAAQDASLVSPLVGILKGAGQEIPSFFEGVSGGSGDFNEGDFASMDIRGNSAGLPAKPAAAAPADEDDDW